jgi:thymidine kinase
MKHHAGTIEVVCGSMFCGKTEELIRRLRRAVIAKQNVQVFKPIIDNRYQAAKVSSHNGDAFEAQPIEKAADLLKNLESKTNVVGIDEAQFFDAEIIRIVHDLADKGIRVILAGLDMDFKGEPFGVMPELLAIAERVDKLSAICMVCGDSASRTQRLVNGNPARYDDPVIIVGASELYEARCRTHHEVPR